MQISEERWRKIKTEYITSDKSLHRIAIDNEIRYDTIRLRSKKEDWEKLRERHRERTVQKTVEKIERQKVEQVEELRSTASAILAKANELIGSETISPQSLKSLSSVLRDVKEILDIRSDADLREQEARILKLQKDAAGEDETKVPKLIVEGMPKEFTV